MKDDKYLQKIYLKLLLMIFFKKIIENKHKLKDAEILKNKLPISVIIFYTEPDCHFSSYPQLLEACNSHRVLLKPHLL